MLILGSLRHTIWARADLRESPLRAPPVAHSNYNQGEANMEQPSPILQFLPLFLMSLSFGFVVRRLAKDKGRNVRRWTIWGFIPFVNLLLGSYFMGAANLRAERKLDALLQAQGKDPASFT